MTPDLDELGKRAVTETEVLPPTMAWIKVRAGRLQQRRRATVALATLPVLLALGLIGWQVLQTDGGPQTIESVDQPETSNDTEEERGDESGSGSGSGSQSQSQSQSDSESESAEAMTVMPNLVGLSAEEARAVLEELGFGVEIMIESGSPSVPSGQVIATEPMAGALAAPGLTVTLLVQSEEPRNYSRYDDPDIQTEDIYPLLVDPSDLGLGWDQFLLSLIPEAVVFSPEDEQIPDRCRTVDPLIIRDGFYAEYGFGESPDDAVLVFSRGDAEQLRSFYDVSLQLEDCYGSRVVEQKPAPEIPGTTAVARYETRDDQGGKAEVILVLHPEFAYSIEISTIEDADPFDLDELVVQLVADYEAANP